MKLFMSSVLACLLIGLAAAAAVLVFIGLPVLWAGHAVGILNFLQPQQTLPGMLFVVVYVIFGVGFAGFKLHKRYRTIKSKQPEPNSFEELVELKQSKICVPVTLVD